jgi:hypothetical protein
MHLLGPLAVLQLALPAQAAGPLMVQVCGGGAPVRLPPPSPMKDNKSACSKICHSAMRKRAGAAHCCDDEEDSPDAA